MTVAIPMQRVAPALPAFVPVASVRVAVQLAVPEAWRLVRHPLALLALVLNVVSFAAVGDNGPRDSFEALTTSTTFFYGVFVYFAANLVATRSRRSSTGELLAPLPAGEHTRTIALCLAVLGPFLVSVLVTAVGWTSLAARGLFEVEPTVWHLAAGPLTVLGGGLLGVMVARWAPYTAVALVVMVAMFAFNVVVSNGAESNVSLGTYVTWARYGAGSDWHGLLPGSASWHAAYLAGLCAMAAAGTLLRTAPRRLPLLLTGAALTALTLAAGAAQLP